MQKPKILLLYYSMYGHIFELSKKIKEGMEAAGADVIMKRVDELVPEQYMDEFAKAAAERQKDIPIADPRSDLTGIDGVIVGTPTRFGNMASQMKNFWDQTGGDWMKGSLVGKPAAVFTSTATQHGGQESTLLASMIPLLHHGCVLVGMPYSIAAQMQIETVQGGTPYGMSTVTGSKGERMPSDEELTMAHAFGTHFVRIASKLQNIN